MSERDVENVWQYVDPESIADSLRSNFDWSEITAEEARIAAEAISPIRIVEVVSEIHREHLRREQRHLQLRQRLEDSLLIDIEDLVEDEDERWYIARQDVKDIVELDGRFVSFTDFRLVKQQVAAPDNTITGLFHTLVLFFLESNPAKHSEVEKELRCKQQNQSWSNEYAPTHRFYLHTESLIPYAADKVDHTLKIPGIGRKGRRIMRAVLFDDQDINDIWLEESSRFNQH